MIIVRSHIKIKVDSQKKRYITKWYHKNMQIQTNNHVNRLKMYIVYRTYKRYTQDYKEWKDKNHYFLRNKKEQSDIYIISYYLQILIWFFIHMKLRYIIPGYINEYGLQGHRVFELI